MTIQTSVLEMEATLQVSGMTCASCVGTIESVLSNEDGIHKVRFVRTIAIIQGVPYFN